MRVVGLLRRLQTLFHQPLIVIEVEATLVASGALVERRTKPRGQKGSSKKDGSRLDDLIIERALLGVWPSPRGKPTSRPDFVLDNNQRWNLTFGSALPFHTESSCGSELRPKN